MKKYKLRFGRLEDLDHDLPIINDLKERFQHTYIIGPSGCGKSTLLTRMALTDIRHGLACIFIDPKGDTIDDIYSRLTKEERNRVIYYSYDNPSLTLNPLQKDDSEIHDVTDEFIEILDIVIRRVSPSNPTMSDNMKEILNESIYLLQEEDRNIENLYNFLRFKDYRGDYFAKHHNGNKTPFWNKADKGHSKSNNILDTADRIATRLNRLLKPEKFKKLFVGKNQYDLASIAKEKKILLVDASGFTADKFFYVIAVFVFGIQSYTRRRIEEKHPIMFYFDEFARTISEGFKELLPWARSFQIGFTLAHQDFHQVSSKEQATLKTVISQCNTKIAFAQRERSGARAMADTFVVPSSEFTEMKNHYAWMRIADRKCFIKTFPLKKAANVSPPPSISSNVGTEEVQKGKYVQSTNESTFLRKKWFSY